MRVFVTGATGFIGSAIVQELIGGGHQVLGLARNAAAADALAKVGVQAHRGELADTDSLSAGAKCCDGVIHTAFIHDFSQFAANAEIDRCAVIALGQSLVGSGRPLVIASGTAMTAFIAQGRLGTEEDSPDIAMPRVASDHAVLSLAPQGVRASVVRLPPTVHDTVKFGLVSGLIQTAREKGVSAYVGEGLNRWPAVHRLDAARVFTLALDKGPGGQRYHAVAEQGVPLRDIATLIGRHLKLPVISISAEEAVGHFGFVGMFAGMDIPASSAQTQERLGWRPIQPGLMVDLDQGQAFAA